MEFTSPSTLAVLENNRVLRHGLKELLCADPQLDVVYQGTCAREVLEGLDDCSPDILVVGFGRDRSENLAFLRYLRGNLPEAEVLVVCSRESELCAREALRAGADGYLSWRQAADELPSAVRRSLSRTAELPIAPVGGSAGDHGSSYDRTAVGTRH